VWWRMQQVAAIPLCAAACIPTMPQSVELKQFMRPTQHAVLQLHDMCSLSCDVVHASHLPGACLLACLVAALQVVWGAGRGRMGRTRSLCGTLSAGAAGGASSCTASRGCAEGGRRGVDVPSGDVQGHPVTRAWAQLSTLTTPMLSRIGWEKVECPPSWW
jgi:hypothetical protein